MRGLPKRDCGDYSVGAHLFPFRTEKLSPTAPMVLPYRWESRSSPNTIALQVPEGLFCFKSRETRSVKRDLLPARARILCGCSRGISPPALVNSAFRIFYNESPSPSGSQTLLHKSFSQDLPRLQHLVQNQIYQPPTQFVPENQILDKILYNQLKINVLTNG